MIPNVFSEPLLLGHNKDALESILLETRALSIGLNVLRLNISHFYIFNNNFQHASGFRSTSSTQTSKVGVTSCVNKSFSRALFGFNNIAVPKGARVLKRERSHIRDLFLSLGQNVVIKPVGGHGGENVHVGVTSLNELDNIIDGLADSYFIMEEKVPGTDYRFSVIGGDVCAVAVRVPASVVGDGSSCVHELVARKNEFRKSNPHLDSRLIKLGSPERACLRSQGLDPESVPSPGRLVLLNNAANLSQGGDSVDVTDAVHPTLKRHAVRIMRALPGITHGGVDMLIPDHQSSMDDQKVYVCEVNSAAGFSMHHFPVFGKPREISYMLTDYVAKTGRLSVRPVAMPEIAASMTVRYRNKRRVLEVLERVAQAYQIDVVIKHETHSELSLRAIDSPMAVAVLNSGISRAAYSGSVEFVQIIPESA